MNLILKFCTIVYGFFETSVAQVEQGQGYTIRVGYLKGARASGVTNLIFDVTDAPGTASKIKRVVIKNFSLEQLLLDQY